MPYGGGGAAAAVFATASTKGTVVEEDVAEARVYVNNMNTPQAIVTIPDRSGRAAGRTAAFHVGRDQRVSGPEAFVGGPEAREAATSSTAAAVVNYSDHASGNVVTKPAATATTALSAGKASSKGVASVSAGKSPSPHGGSTSNNNGATRHVEDVEQLHPNLEAVYARIMRRLQRELNYEELNRVSLADQYGVVSDLGDSEAHVATLSPPQSGAAGPPTAAGATGDGDGDGEGSAGAHSGSRLESFAGSVTGSMSQRNSAAVSGWAGEASQPRPEKGKTATSGSMVVRYGRRKNSAAGRTAAVSGGGTAGGGALVSTSSQSGPGQAGGGTVDEVEQSIASQPCPRTLRLVVQHVQETLMNKMAMAERGSVKDCLRLTFESRALLDRLLKEAPTYFDFPADPDHLPLKPSADLPPSRGAGDRRSSGGCHRNGSRTAAGHKLQELYQEFRKQPVLLPRATFAQDRATGAVDAVLNFAQEAALGLHTGQQPQQRFGSTATASAGSGSVADEGDDSVSVDVKCRPSTALPPPLLPAPGRGSTATSKGLVGHLANVAREVVGSTPSMSLLSGVGVGAASPQSSGGMVLPPTYGKSCRRMNTSTTSSRGATESVLLSHELPHGLNRRVTNVGHDESPHRETSCTTVHSANASVSASVDRAHTLTPPEDPQCANARVASTLPHPHLPAAVSTVSVGTLTEENAANTITQEMYDEVQRYAAGLEVQLAEARSTHAGLTAQLLEEKDYVGSRQRIMNYLRETLVRECNMLRSQLNFAAHREQQLQQSLREKQQQQQQQQQQHTAGQGHINYQDTAGLAGASISPSRSMAGIGGGAAVSWTARHGSGGPRQSVATSVAAFNGNNNGPRYSTSRAGPANASEENSCSHISAATIGSPAMLPSSGAAGGRFGSPTSRTNTTLPVTLSCGGGGVTPGVEGNPSQLNRNEHSVASTGSGNGGGVSAAALTASHDITSMQSLLDLILLAVENDEVFPTSLGAVKALGPDLVKQTMTKDLKHQSDALRASFEEKSKRLQDTIVTQRIRNNYVVVEKDKEIARLEKLADLSYVEQTLLERVATLRTEQRKLRNQIHEALQSFRVMMNTVVTGILNRTRLMDQTANDNAILHNTQDALKDLIEGASSLLMPMLTPEYVRGGFHPWPLKLRNTTDPLVHVVHSRYGPAEVVRLREQLTTFSGLYVAVYRFVSQHATYPDPARPSVAEPLRLLCGRLALNPRSNTDVIFEVRQRYDRELHLQRAIARVNYRLLWNVYLQRAYTERSVSALATAGMDPYTTTLPVGRRVNELAAARGSLTHERNNLLKERVENAKQVYRLWRERAIDIHEGFSPPAVGAGSRLTVLAEAPVMAPPSAVSLPPRTSLATHQGTRDAPCGEDEVDSGSGDASPGLPRQVRASATTRELRVSTTTGDDGDHALPLDRRTGSAGGSPGSGGGVRKSPRCSQPPGTPAQSYLGAMVESPMVGHG